MNSLYKQQFFGYWRWVHIRQCPECGKSTKILGNDTRRLPMLPPGAIYCPHCNIGTLSFNGPAIYNQDK